MSAFHNKQAERKSFQSPPERIVPFVRIHMKIVLHVQEDFGIENGTKHVSRAEYPVSIALDFETQTNTLGTHVRDLPFQRMSVISNAAAAAEDQVQSTFKVL